jgi:hypothetical protein
MNWTLIFTFCAGLWVGSNIPRAWQQWKVGTAYLRNYLIENRKRRQTEQ